MGSGFEFCSVTHQQCCLPVKRVFPVNLEPVWDPEHEGPGFQHHHYARRSCIAGWGGPEVSGGDLRGGTSTYDKLPTWGMFTEERTAEAGPEPFQHSASPQNLPWVWAEPLGDNDHSLTVPRCLEMADRSPCHSSPLLLCTELLNSNPCSKLCPSDRVWVTRM